MKTASGSSPTQSIHQLFQDEQSKIVLKHGTEALSEVLPSFDKMKSGLFAKRAEETPNLPVSAANIVLEEKHKLTVDNPPQRFLLYDNNKSSRIMIFCSDLGLKILGQSERWHGDGKFHTASKYFSQLYILQAWYEHRMIPVAWILMKKRKFVDYKNVFSKIKKKANLLGILLNPKQIMTDMELGAMKAFKYNWPSANIKACLFHVCQAWFKNLVKQGLKEAYDQDENLRKWFKKLFTMALISPDDVDEFWEKVIVSEYDVLKSSYPSLEKFVEYIINNYFEGSFPVTMWNHFKTVGNRTNNHLEGYNHKLKNFIGAKAPNIFKSVKFFQDEEANAALRYHRANSSNKNTSRPPRRAHLDIEKESKLEELTSLYKDHYITYEIFVERVINFYDFNRAKIIRMEKDGELSDDLSESKNKFILFFIGIIA